MIVNLSVFAQSKIDKLKSEIVEEGKRLYFSEMASWYGSDLFMQKYQLKNNIGGYFSYTENSVSKCIFFSRGDKPKVIGTISFSPDYNLETANTDLVERDFSEDENELYTIRKNALVEMNRDTIYKQYENTNLNLVPIISNGEKKVYVLTGPKKNGVVIFGNDYLLTFDNENNFKKSKRLHKNILISEYGNVDGDKNKTVVAAMHNHQPETGDLITPTDICTTMLYEKFAGWETVYVMSKKYVSIWNCKSDNLMVITREAWENMNEEIKKNK